MKITVLELRYFQYLRFYTVSSDVLETLETLLESSASAFIRATDYCQLSFSGATELRMLLASNRVIVCTSIAFIF